MRIKRNWIRQIFSKPKMHWFPPRSDTGTRKPQDRVSQVWKIPLASIMKIAPECRSPKTIDAVTSHLASRGIHLSAFEEFDRLQIVRLLSGHFLQYGHLHHLEGVEDTLNDKIYWQPKPEVSNPTVRNFFRICGDILRGKCREDFFPRRNEISSLRLQETTTILSRITSETQFQTNRFFLRQLPKELTAHDVKVLYRQSRPKPRGFWMNGAPGRFVLLPTYFINRPFRSLDPQLIAEYSLVYYPVDEQLQAKVEQFDLNHHRLIQLDRHQNHQARRFKHTHHGHFPGSLAFGRLGIYDVGGIRKGVIWEWQSDITPSFPAVSPADLPRRMISPLTALSQALDCRQTYIPTFATIWKRVHPDDYDSKAVDQIRRRLSYLYPSFPPKDWQVTPGSFGDEEHLILSGHFAHATFS